MNRLIQISKINIPIISIAAAGYLSNTDLPNSLYLVVGENDIHHYEAAQEFYTKSKNMPLKVTLIEHKDGHIIPWPIIEELLISFKDQA